MDATFATLVRDVRSAEEMEVMLVGSNAARSRIATAKGNKNRKLATTSAANPPAASVCVDPVVAAAERVKRVVEVVHEARKKQRPDEVHDCSDDVLCEMARYTDMFALKSYERFLEYVPRIVNVVTLAEAVPAEGSGLVLPLDLRAIASKCTGAYYAPKRFAAVQLAFHTPRARVLVFHTGRLVGTGTEGPMAARVAIAKAQRQLAVEAGVHLCVRGFSVINSVGATSLNARLDCESFASAHRATSHYDRSSFVGLAWRPPNQSICCEVYSTGRANLPGSVVERMLQKSWRDMLPELLAFSTARAQLRLFPEMQDFHAVLEEEEESVSAEETRPSDKAVFTGWEDWAAGDDGGGGGETGSAIDDGDAKDDIDDDTLGALGL